MRSRWWLYAALALAPAVGIGVGLSLWQTRGAAPSARASAAPGGPGRSTGSSTRDESFVAVLVARESLDVTARVAARVETVHVRLGDEVETGARLVSLDPRPARDELALGKAALMAAQAEEVRAQAELEDTRLRLERLLPVAAQIAKDELDTARVNASNAEARLKAAVAQVAQAQTRVSILTTALADMELRAPFAGRVAARYVAPGAAVSAGTPLLRLTQLDDLILRFGVPEPIARSLKAGLPVSFRAEGLPGELSGRIEHLAPEVDTASLLVIVEATVDVPAELKGKLPSGVTGRVMLQTPLLGQHP